MNNRILMVNVNSCSIFNSPRVSSELTNEALFGEEFEIYKEESDFYYGKLLTDGYLGWIERKYLTQKNFADHMVTSLRTLVYKSNDIKSRVLNYLPMCARVKVLKKDNFWSFIKYQADDISEAYVINRDIKKINYLSNNWTNVAFKFQETPYKWGGRNSVAVDCSALIQLSFQSCGISFPRDTNLQIKSNLLDNVSFKEIRKGDLVFWQNHVAMFLDQKRIIHSNGFHMKVVIEQFLDAKDRISKIYNSNPKYFRLKSHLLSS